MEMGPLLARGYSGTFSQTPNFEAHVYNAKKIQRPTKGPVEHSKPWRVALRDLGSLWEELHSDSPNSIGV